MQGQRRYKKAPIKEAVIDLRVSLPEEISLDTLGNISSLVSDDFPKTELFIEVLELFIINQESPLR